LIIRDISILHGGHFAILLTGVDNVTIENVTIDTNRDGIDVDASRNVRISNTSVNSPVDDAIVLKTSYALGELRPTENVTITNSLVSGFTEGTLLDGTYRAVPAGALSEGRSATPVGRIKLGTESNGDFRNITISNVIFDHCRGLALESVDGSHLEDVSISNVTMREVGDVPIFIRLGRRMRGPETLSVGSVRRVSISDVVVYDSDAKQAVLIAGIPGHPIEQLRLSNIQLTMEGGAPEAQAAVTVPEMEEGYPEPYYFGALPAYGFFLRHVRGLRLNDVEVQYLKPDARPAFVLEDVHDADFHHVTAEAPVGGSPTYVLRDVSDFHVEDSRPVGDVEVEQATQKSF
jgi:polygalacturonase